MIKIEHLKKEYPNVTPLKDVSVEINDGDVISIIGPSGTGKSTLLRCINQLEKPTSGRIWVDDVEITSPRCDINKVRQKMGMVFQSFNLFGHRTVIENIMMAPMDLLGKSKQEAYDTKVDRSGAYMARKIARDIVNAGYAEQCEVQIAYAIGVAEPVSINVECFGTEQQDIGFIEAYVRENYDLTPRGIINSLRLRDVDYNAVSAYGHFGKPGLPWEE